MRAFSVISALYGCMLGVAKGELVTHDETFVPDHVLRVTKQNISVACEHRMSVVINGTSPGPTLRLKPGKSTWIRVYNDMSDSNLTMHWHGLAQRFAHFSDGSPQASQWPIKAKHFFDYEVETELDDAGTYFYHSHIGMQALTASGALIVDDCAKPPYDYDEERILFWNDYFNKTDEVLEAGLVGVPFVFGGETNAVLLNGKGIGIGHTANETGKGACEPPVIDVQPGKTYRFRFIGSTSLSHTSIGFEGHSNLSVIQIDGGQWTRPASFDRIQLGSGQRYDVLFKAKTKEELKAEGKSSYFIQFETKDRPSSYRGYGILRYEKCARLPSLPTEPVLRLPNATYDWGEYTLQPLHPDPNFPSLAEVTRRVILDARQMISNETKQWIWKMANLSYTDNVAHVPLLVDIYQRGDAAVPDYDAAMQNHGWDPKTKAFPAKVGEVLEIVFQNTGSLANSGGGVDVHPFHAHGQHFYDIGSGNGTYNATENEAKIVKAGYHPVQRDTSMLYRYITTTKAGLDAGWRAWRIRVDQPGVWLIHCHTLQHMMMGMQTVWVIGNATEIQKIPLEESQGYFYYGGDVYGNETFNPHCSHQFGNTDSCPKYRLF